jgi:hypothetical protein
LKSVKERKPFSFTFIQKSRVSAFFEESRRRCEAVSSSREEASQLSNIAKSNWVTVSGTLSSVAFL